MKNVMTPERLTPEIVMETGKELRKALLSTLTPQEVQQLLKKLTPEERLAGLAPEELTTLLEQIEMYLRTQSGDKAAPK